MNLRLLFPLPSGVGAVRCRGASRSAPTIPLKRGYAYQQHVSNFDALLAHLEITHSRVLQSLLDDLTVSLITESPKDFNKHVSRVLRKLANKEKPHIAKTLEQLEAALENIKHPNFRAFPFSF